ncbi:phage terminase large subunit family protein [Methylobacterium sp. J-030]|uniref:phage terminase large subunit family protein n=1 Tax=Methylobacterium sp. J-030 TaxID=2836627 RepID=UPI001FBA12DA|nr:terminase gpA endonuclease subunit [Methylobacterium sp. J-030]MCJ2067765.1 phage terminase large subunit family protein [Methylobacterium sp. J-030]
MARATAAEISTRIEAHRPGSYRSGRGEYRHTILGLFGSALIKPPRMSGSQWAEEFGRIPKSTGADSGKIVLYGYQRGLLDAMCDPTVPRVTVMKAARVGYTRCFTLAVGYHLHHAPTLCAIAQPVKEDAEDFGGTEIAPMLRETPVLKRMMRPVRKGEKQDKATFFKLSNGASARLVGAAADDAFRRYSAQFMAADEIDADGWTPDYKSQGDKLDLFWTRGEKFWNRKLIVGSTPVLEETSRIAALWAKSDQRRYFVPCPQCSDAAGHLDGWQYLEWGGKETLTGIKWEEEKGRVKRLWYVGQCGCLIDESRKAWMDANGEWRPTNPDGDHPGFHLWTGMSLDLNASWQSIAQEWLNAQIDPINKVQPFVNLRLGRTYRASFDRESKASELLGRVEFYGAEVPEGVWFLTLGGDVQSGENARIEGGVYGWGRGNESWLIGHFVLPGDPGEAAVWQDLDRLLGRRFKRADGRTIGIQAAAIDSGGHYTAETYALCNERRRRRIWAIKGRSEMRGKRSPVWPRKPSGNLGSAWYMIGGNAARDYAYQNLSIEKPGPRYAHFTDQPAAGSREIDDDFFEQLTCETRVTRRQGFTEWDKPKKPREAGVCFVYAYAAVCGLQASNGRYVALGSMSDADEPAVEAAQAPPAVPLVEIPSSPAPATAPPSGRAGPSITSAQPTPKRTLARRLAR